METTTTNIVKNAMNELYKMVEYARNIKVTVNVSEFCSVIEDLTGVSAQKLENAYFGFEAI